jgi:hypothetical protein
VIQLPNRIAEQVTQHDLVQYRLLAKELSELRELLRQKRKEIETNLLAGAAVEKGLKTAAILRIKGGYKTIQTPANQVVIP